MCSIRLGVIVRGYIEVYQANPGRGRNYLSVHCLIYVSVPRGNQAAI